jgi:hypothetical protein
MPAGTFRPSRGGKVCDQAVLCVTRLQDPAKGRMTDLAFDVMEDEIL